MEILIKRVPIGKGYDMACSMNKMTSLMCDCSSDELIKDILMETFEKTRDYGDAIVSGDEQ